MADIDLKTETPDTSLPTTGFLFGADSQAAASPSVFTVQSVATTLLGSTTLTGATVTTSSPVIDAAQTWNDGGVTFTGLRFNAAGTSDANSAAGSLLMDLQVGGTSQFSVRKNGDQFFSTNRISFVGTTSSQEFQLANNNSNGNAQFGFRVSSAPVLRAVAQAQLTWVASTTTVTAQVPDLILTRRAAANLRLGAADAAAPVAQTLSVQSVVAGTTDTAGANLTITGSQGTGTGAGGSIIFQVAPAGSSGTAQNALATALTIGSNRNATFAASIQFGAGQNLDNATNSVNLSDLGFGLSSAATVAWSSAGANASKDTILTREAAGVTGVRGANTTTGGALGFIEQTAPAAPAANGVRIYAEDNGSGKTRLMALFNTGAAQQIAIEP